MAESRRIQRSDLVLILLVLLLAAALRIYHITQQSLWFDEAFAWNIIQQHDMYPRIAADTHPPLYYVLLRGWVAVAGDSALSLRYLSAMFSTMTVTIVYQVARELARGRRGLAHVPLLAALVIALSDAEIFLAQESRNYALYTLTASLSMWLYLRWLRRTSQGNAAGWALGTAALMYTHYQGIFIPAVQGMHILLFLRGRRRLHAIGILAVSGAIFAPWFFGVTLPQAKRAIDNSLPYAIPSNWKTFLHLRDSYLGSQWALMAGLAIVGLGTLAKYPSPLNPLSHKGRGNLKAQSGGLGIALTGKRWRGLPTAFLVLMWFLLPFGVLYFGNLYQALLTERKLLIIVPAISLMIGFGLGWLRQPGRGLLVAVIVVYGAATVDYYRLKEPWREISAKVVPYVQPTDLAMVEAGVGQYAMKYYWSHLLPDSVYMTTFPFPQIRDWTLAPTTDRFTYYDGLLPQLLEETKTNRIGQVATAWFIYWDKEQVNFQKLAEAGYVRTMTITYTHLGDTINLYRYDHLPEQAIVDFENGMILRAVEIDPDALRVDLWWETDLPLTADYTTSVKLFDAAGNVVAQQDSPVRDRPTTTWTEEDTVYDGKFLELVNMQALPPGEYTVTAEVYQWTPDGIINVPTVDGEERFEVGRINW